jgi:hypothetical protein
MSNVVPFPPPKKVAEGAVGLSASWQRMAAASIQLEEANRVCGQSVAEFRRVLSRLDEVIGHMGQNMVEFDAKMGEAGRQVDVLHGHAVKLGETMSRTAAI